MAPLPLEWTTVFSLAGVVVGVFFFAVLLGRKSPNLRARRILAVLVLCLSYLIAYDALFTFFYLRFPHIIGTASPIVFLLGPLVFLYIRSCLRPGRRSWAGTVVHFVPFAVALVVKMPFYLASAAEKIALTDELLRLPETRITPEIAARLGHIFLYLTLSIIFLGRWRREAKSVLSDPGVVDLGWLKSLLIAFWALLAVSSAFLLVPHLSPFLFSRVYPVFKICEPLILILIGYRGLIQPEATSGPDSGPKYEKSPLRADPAQRYAESVREVMRTEEPFLEPDLTLSALAARIGLPPYQLSQVLNEHLNKNFYEFINGYRIEKAKALLANPGTGTKLLAVAYESGFQSKSTFNRVFKEMTGMTPSEFRKSVVRTDGAAGSRT